MTAAVDVVVPGLAGPPVGTPGQAAGALAALCAGLELPGLAALLRRGVATPGAAGDATVATLAAGLLGYPSGGAFPAAALARIALGEDPDATPRAWLRADPVHLRADLAKLIVFPPRALALTLDHASRIVDWLNAQEHFPIPRLELVTPQCWVVGLEADPGMESVSPDLACGRNATAVLPAGGDAPRWHARMNEIQMLLHACPVNAEREREGLVPVNSVWFWGAGAAPPAWSATDHAGVWCDDPALAGVGRLAGVPVRPVPADGDAWCRVVDAGRQLLALDPLELPARAADVDGWRAAVQELDARWFAPLASALAAGRVRRVDLHCGEGVVHARRARRWQRWFGRGDPVALLARLRTGVVP